MTETYHLRRAEAAITTQAEMQEILRGQTYMTLALCRDNTPYLVTMNYGYDPDQNCLYFHCARKGKKIDYLSANPRVWGQVLEDNGIIPGACDHAFRCVEFSGQVEFLEDEDEKLRALAILVDQLEPDPELVKAQMLTRSKVGGVNVAKVSILSMTGKHRESEE